MPKKTKKAKLIAEYRRKLTLLESDHHTVPPINTTKQTDSTLQLPVLPLTQSKEIAVLLPELESFAIRKELTKTLIIAFGFILVEFILWKVLG